MHVAVISTYPPRACGIATFSADLYESLQAAPGVDRVDIMAITAHDETYAAPVCSTIAQQSRADYVRVAGLIGRLGVDVVIVQHEYGIFGGRDGEYILSLTGELDVPYVVTLHTVLSDPTPSQAAILDELCRRAGAVMVFTQLAADMLVSRHHVNRERVRIIPHGAPEAICAVASNQSTVPLMIGGQQRDTRGRFVVSSFGLISRGKGLETLIDATATVSALHPEVLVVIAGRTHPEVVRREGERYRLRLQERVRDLGIGDHVVFDDRFLSVAELAKLLAATDVFVTPYSGRDQIVSGALTFAIAAGRPVISTPYLYAEEMLADGAGRLVPFGDSAAIAASIGDLIERPTELARLGEAARRTGAALSWAAVGVATAGVLADAVHAGASREAPLVGEPILPPLRLDHLRILVDDVGIVQHARGSAPNLGTGYCVDDVARLLLLADQLDRRLDDLHWRVVGHRAVAFLWHATEGTAAGMHNFMSYDRRWIDQPTVGDHVGRTLWSLGTVLESDGSSSFDFALDELLQRLAEQLDPADVSLRTAAYALLGLARPQVVKRHGELASALADRLVRAHAACAGESWDWFEPSFAYDNARLSQALVVAGGSLSRPELTSLGLRTLRWYGDQCTVAGTLQLPANIDGDEQPLDAAALVEAEIDALTATGDPTHGRRALAAFEWFTGRNHLGVSLYDSTTGGCCDGLATDHVNLNQGAESTLAYFSARLAIEAAGLPVIARRHARTAQPEGRPS